MGSSTKRLNQIVELLEGCTKSELEAAVTVLNTDSVMILREMIAENIGLNCLEDFDGEELLANLLGVCIPEGKVFSTFGAFLVEVIQMTMQEDINLEDVFDELSITHVEEYNKLVRGLFEHLHRNFGVQR